MGFSRLANSEVCPSSKVVLMRYVGTIMFGELPQQELNCSLLTLLNRSIQYYRQFEHVHSTKGYEVLPMRQAYVRFYTTHNTENMVSTLREMIV